MPALLEEDGFRVDIVHTRPGLATYKDIRFCPGITEVQSGQLLGDGTTLYKPFAPDFRLALTVLTRVVSFSNGGTHRYSMRD